MRRGLLADQPGLAVISTRDSDGLANHLVARLARLADTLLDDAVMRLGVFDFADNPDGHRSQYHFDGKFPGPPDQHKH